MNQDYFIRSGFRDDEFIVDCNRCGASKYLPEDTYWDENGYGYSTKLVNCPICGRPVILEYIEDNWVISDV